MPVLMLLKAILVSVVILPSKALKSEGIRRVYALHVALNKWLWQLVYLRSHAQALGSAIM